MGNNSGVLMLGLLALAFMYSGKSRSNGFNGGSYVGTTHYRNIYRNISTVNSSGDTKVESKNRIVTVNRGSIDKPVMKTYTITPQAERFVSPVPVLTRKSRSTARNVYQIR